MKMYSCETKIWWYGSEIVSSHEDVGIIDRRHSRADRKLRFVKPTGVLYARVGVDYIE